MHCLTIIFFYQEIIKSLPRHLKIVDLSAVCSAHTIFTSLIWVRSRLLLINYCLQDFRLRDINEYAEWYGHSHRAPELQVSYYYLHFKILGVLELKKSNILIFDHQLVKIYVWFINRFITYMCVSKNVRCWFVVIDYIIREINSQSIPWKAFLNTNAPYI